jgi:hypothetical protein
MKYEFFNLEKISEQMTELIDKLIESYPEFDKVDVSFFNHGFSYGIIAVKMQKSLFPEEEFVIERAYFSICSN